MNIPPAKTKALLTAEAYLLAVTAAGLHSCWPQSDEHIDHETLHSATHCYIHNRNTLYKMGPFLCLKAEDFFHSCRSDHWEQLVQIGSINALH